MTDKRRIKVELIFFVDVPIELDQVEWATICRETLLHRIDLMGHTLQYTDLGPIDKSK